MKKLGVIFALHSLSKSELESVMEPWLALKGKNLFDIVFTCVSYTFEENRADKSFLLGNKETIKLIKESNLFSYCFTDEDTSRENMQEGAVRDMALQFLRGEGCDVVALWDGDEYATNDQLVKIFEYVEKYNEYCWYSLSYKNFVFDRSTYLTEPFCPPRIYRAKYGEYAIHSFYLDNEVFYKDKQGKNVSFRTLPTKNVPKQIAFIRHMTWLSDERSKRKVAYQKKHFGQFGDDCSYDWDETNDRLIFNLDFFKKRGLMLPEIDYEEQY